MHHGAQNAHTGGHDDKARISVGLRPQRSTSPIAMKVASTLVRPTITVPTSVRWCWYNPPVQNLRRVIHDDVHPGELLHHLQQDAEEYGTAEVAVFFKQFPARLLDLQAFTNLIQFTFGFGAGIAGASVRVPHQQSGVWLQTSAGYPAKDNANQQQNRR